jgi:hypothetical protein
MASVLGQRDTLSILFLIAIDPTNNLLYKSTKQGLLHPLQGRSPTTHTSLYADDVVVFIACIKGDIVKLASIVTSFGDVSSLLANSQRSIVAPFQCCNIDLDDVLLPFPVAKTTFPMRYLNLPLSVNILHMWIYNILRIKSLKNSSSDIEEFQHC